MGSSAPGVIIMNSKKIEYVLSAILCAGFAVQAVYAHPHMFIDVMMKFVLTETGISGYYVYWDFDEMKVDYLILRIQRIHFTRMLRRLSRKSPAQKITSTGRLTTTGIRAE